MVSRVRVGGLVGALLAVAALVLVVPIGRVWAHAELVSSEPADGATLEAPPPALLFTFGEQLMGEGAAITAQHVDSGEWVGLPPVTVSGDAASAAWPATSASGPYRASYRVVSADGHPITGSITFTILAATDASGSPSAADPSPPQGGTTDPDPQEASSGVGVLGWILGLGIVVLVGAGAGTWYTRRSRGL